MTYPVITLPAAEVDIIAAADWLRERNPDAAARWVEDIRLAIVSLEEMPARCPHDARSRRSSGVTES
jgi:plasmid stabilization system protein ParE